jgi:hypothetical protein
MRSRGPIRSVRATREGQTRAGRHENRRGAKPYGPPAETARLPNDGEMRTQGTPHLDHPSQDRSGRGLETVRTDARGLGEKRLASFLARHGYCGGKSAAELLARLRCAPEGRAQGAEEKARRTAVLSLVAALKPLVEQIGVLDSRIADAVRAHPDGEVFLSLFRDPGLMLTAAKVLSPFSPTTRLRPSS